MFLSKNRRLELLAPLFAGTADDPFDGGYSDPSANDVISVLRLSKSQDLLQSNGDGKTVYFSSSGPMTLDVTHSAIVSGVIELSMPQAESDETENPDPELFVDKETLVIRFQQNRWEIDVAKLLETVQAVPRADFGYPPLVVTLPGRAGDARMVLLNLNGSLEDDQAEITYIRALIILPAPLSRLQDG